MVGRGPDKPGMFQNPHSLAIVLGLGVASWVLVAALVALIIWLLDLVGAATLAGIVGCALGSRWVMRASRKEQGFAKAFGVVMSALLAMAAVTMTGVLNYVLPVV